MRGDQRYLMSGYEFIISRWSLKRTSLRCNARWREIGNEDGSNTPASMLFFFNSLREPSSSIGPPEALSSSLCCPVSLQYWTVVRILRSKASPGLLRFAAASAFLHLHFHFNLRLLFLCFVEVAIRDHSIPTTRQQSPYNRNQTSPLSNPPKNPISPQPNQPPRKSLPHPLRLLNRAHHLTNPLLHNFLFLLLSNTQNLPPQLQNPRVLIPTTFHCNRRTTPPIQRFQKTSFGTTCYSCRDVV